MAEPGDKATWPGSPFLRLFAIKSTLSRQPAPIRQRIVKIIVVLGLFIFNCIHKDFAPGDTPDIELNYRLL